MAEFEYTIVMAFDEQMQHESRFISKEETQILLDQYSNDGWKLHTVTTGALFFERQKKQKGIS